MTAPGRLAGKACPTGMRSSPRPHKPQPWGQGLANAAAMTCLPPPPSSDARHKHHRALSPVAAPTFGRLFARMAKLKLDNIAQPEVHLIAISSHVNDYRLCWALNNSLGIALARRRNDITDHGNGRTVHFPVFDHFDEEAQAGITLVSNRAPGGVLVAHRQQADFFLVVDAECPLDPTEALHRVKRAEFVLAAFPLAIDAVKDGYKLLE